MDSNMRVPTTLQLKRMDALCRRLPPKDKAIGDHDHTHRVGSLTPLVMTESHVEDKNETIATDNPGGLEG
jgi:hypothetical protein